MRPWRSTKLRMDWEVRRPEVCSAPASCPACPAGLEWFSVMVVSEIQNAKRRTPAGAPSETIKNRRSGANHPGGGRAGARRIQLFRHAPSQPGITPRLNPQLHGAGHADRVLGERNRG